MLNDLKLAAARNPAIARAAVYARGVVNEIIYPTVVPQTEVAGGRPRLLFDVTQTSSMKVLTGIQRVVQRISRELLNQKAELPYQPVLVRLERRGRKIELVEAGAYSKHVSGRTYGCDPIRIRPQDTLVTFDSTWLDYQRYTGTIIPAIRANGGKVFSGLYDMIPVTHPEYFSGFVVPAFERWLKLALAHSDGIISISNTTQDNLEAYIKRDSFDPGVLKLASFRLGSDFAQAGDVATPLPSNIPTVLMVGTIEPRKGHDIAVAAFKRLWDEKIPVRLQIIGRVGWKTEDLYFELLNNDNPNLLASFGANDTVLLEAYANCGAILTASRVEGFGLSIIEGARFGKPLIVSDIPIFRETTGGQAIFFDPKSSDDLVRAIKVWLANPTQPTPLKPISWRESAEDLVRTIERLSMQTTKSREM